MIGVSEDDEWKDILESTYKVANEMIGRKKAYDETIAKGLNIAGKYQVKPKKYKCSSEKSISILYRLQTFRM